MNIKSGAFGSAFKLIKLKRAGIELIILAALGDKLVMAALLDDPSVFKNNDHIRVPDGRKSVRDHKHGPALHQTVHTLFDQLFGSGID